MRDASTLSRTTPIFISGPTIGLRSLEGSDASSLHRWINDPQVNVFSTMAVLPRSYTSVEQMILDSLKSETTRALVVEHHEVGPIGLCQLRHKRNHTEGGVAVGAANHIHNNRVGNSSRGVTGGWTISRTKV